MLNDNKIEISHNETFQGLSRLEFLHLQNNRISHLPEGIFHPLEYIAWIDLSNNRIASLPENIFAYFTRLEGLDLRKNPLTKIVISTELHYFMEINHLFLSDCAQLKEVKLDIAVMHLTLDNSGLESLKINRSIKSIQAENSNLTHLDLRGALFMESISDSICRIRSLEWLDLSVTTLNDVDFHKCLLPNLRFLNISYNLIKSLPMGSPLFGPHLITLDLSSNWVQNFSFDSLKEAHSLQRLYLDNNELTSFDYHSLDQFKNLTDFTFHGNNFNDTFNEAVTMYWNRHQMGADAKNLKVVVEEQKKDYMWIWITVPIVVVLLMAVVWLVLKKRGND
ncbi:hypothetical protein KR032_007064 [Drosophila birchii]|nr:hypothetical protein KR032_007064 [Drosophila birchii]